MHIGIFTHNYPRTANDRRDAGIFLYDFAHELSKKASVFVLCPDFLGEKENYKDVPVTWFKWSGGDKKLGSWNALSPQSLVSFVDLIKTGNKAAQEFVKKNKIDFCLAAWAIPSGIFTNSIKSKLGIPYATWSLGSDINQYIKFPILRQLIKFSLTNASIRFVNSYALRDKIQAFTGKNSRFLPAITRFETARVKPENLPKDKFNFLFVGRLEKVKGPDILLNAVGHLAKKRNNFAVYIVGSGGMEEKLKKKTNFLNISDKIFFLGQKGAQEVASLMLASDCLIISSRNESLPLVLIEASRTGLPIIATNVGDCARLINDYGIGLLVHRTEPKELVKVMEKALVEDKNFKKNYGKGTKKLSRDFALKNSVNQFLQEVRNSI